MSSKSISSNEAWSILFKKYDIVNHVEKDGIFKINSDDIKEYREPRLMAKYDSSELLPSIFKENDINILPISRSQYVLGNFLLYQNIPEADIHVDRNSTIKLPDFETLDIDDIKSEATAINVLVISQILDDFLNTDTNIETFNGRMGTGKFTFVVDTTKREKKRIDVDGAQMEIDGGFENSNSVVILEAKNVLHKDFHVRQLYYPYRYWKGKVNKPVRCVFSIYSNKVFRLFEYAFDDDNDYSSIRLVNKKCYSLEDTKITVDDIKLVLNNTNVDIDDNQLKFDIPFIQADSFERVISLLENIYENPMTDEEIAELMHFGPSSTKNGHLVYRQSQYYSNAGKYLGLFKKEKINGKIHTCLTELGNDVYRMNYKDRQLKLVELMLKHKIFNWIISYYFDNEEIPNNKEIEIMMKRLNVCNDSQIGRRAQSVKAWAKWILDLTNV